MIQPGSVGVADGVGICPMMQPPETHAPVMQNPIAKPDFPARPWSHPS